MNPARRLGSLVKRAALWAGAAALVLSIIITALGFLAAATFLELTRHTPPEIAAALTGAALLALALLVALIARATLKRLRAKQPPLLAEFGGAFGLATNLLIAIIRRDPKKALIVSLISGALAEYILSDRRK
jgi:protein-S-isoprenylcysteine O-methyltransferase Ste14